MNIIIKATDNATPNIRRIGKALGGMGKIAGNIKSDLKVAAMGIAGLAAGALAFTASSIKAAAEDQQSTNTLIATLKARKFNTDKLAGSIDRLIQKGQDLAFTDDEVRGSIEGATRFTKKFSIAQKITAAAMNLSRSTGMSLQDATIAVGKAYQGNGGKLLKTIGINAKHIAGMQAIIAITNKTKGASSAYANSAAGQFEIVKIKLAEIKETFGGAFLDAVAKVFKALQPYLDRFSNFVKARLPQIKKFADDLANKIIAKLPQLFLKLEELIPKAMDKIGEFARTISGIGDAANGLLGPGGSITALVTGIGLAFGGLKGAIGANLLKNGVDPFTALIVTNVLDVVPKALAEVFTKAIVTKAIAAFGTSVAAAAAGGAVAEGVAGAAAGGAATAAGAAGFSAMVIAALPGILAAAAVVAAVGGLALVINEMNKNPVQEIQNMPGFTAPSIFDILFPKKGAFSTGAGLGTNNPMTAKYTPTVNVYIGQKKFDATVKNTLGQIISGSGGR